MALLPPDGTPIVCETVGERKDGTSFWLLESTGLAPDDSGELTLIQGALFDITERKRAEAERERLMLQVESESRVVQALATRLQGQRDLLQALMENTRAHLAYLDPDFNFVQVNTTYAVGCGYGADELMGRNHFELFPDPENRAIFERVRASGESAEFRAKPFVFANEMMTALMAAIGLFPAAISFGIGSESSRPLARVVIGGILCAMLFSLWVFPLIFRLAYKKVDTKHRNPSEEGEVA